MYIIDGFPVLQLESNGKIIWWRAPLPVVVLTNGDFSILKILMTAGKNIKKKLIKKIRHGNLKKISG